MNYTIFDICGTLYRSNTTFDFLSHFLHENRFYCLYERLYRLPPWKAMNYFLYRGFGIDLTRIIAIKFLKGYNREELVCGAQRFYDEVLIQKINASVMVKLKQFIAESPESTYIASATIDVVAEVIAQRLGVSQFVSTKLAYSPKGLCTGCIAFDLLGHKQHALDKCGVYLPFQGVYTDNFSDLPLLLNSKENYIITYPKTKKKWNKILKRYKLQASIIES